MTKLENQLCQQANPSSERPKGTLPSQPLPNPRNFRQANEAQDPNQCNLVYTLRSGKQVDNQVSMSSSSIQASTSSSPTPPNSKQKESAEQVHEPIAPFLNRLRNNNNAHIEKIFETFNQVKINLPLLEQYNKSLFMQNSLRTCAPRRERLMCWPRGLPL